MLRGVSGAALAPYVRVALGFSIISNLTLLVSPLYMLQVYDRVLASGSIETLILISLIAAVLMCVFVFAELGRRRAVALAVQTLEAKYDRQIFEEALQSPNPTALRSSQTDLSTMQTFLSNGMILPLFDLPFTPFFLLLLFLVHPMIGWLGVAGAITLLAIAAYSEIATRQATELAQSAEHRALTYATTLERQRSAVLGMGMVGSAYETWKQRKDAASSQTLSSATDNVEFSATTRGLRMMLQIAALGVGAALVLAQQTTPGAIIAGAIILGRALAPIDQSVGIWRQIVRFRTAWRNLGAKLFAEREQDEITSMPRPDPILLIENLKVGVPKSESPLFPKFSLTVEKGEIVCLVGGIGAGKTSLLQTMSGFWRPLGGSVRLGRVDVHHWAADDRGRYVGYLPQGGELLPGTVTQNISRFQEAGEEEIFAAARMVDAHGTISALPKAYDTQVGPDGTHISAGQTAKIALARAFFRDPVLVLLDEPSANLDSASRAGLIRTLGAAQSQGAIVLIATHDPALIEICDKVVLLSAQRIAAVTPRDYLESSVLPRVSPSREREPVS